MALIDLDGTLDGAGNVAAPLVAWVFVGGNTQGSSTFVVDPTVTFLMGGQVYGKGNITFDGSTLTGNAFGVGELTAAYMVQTYNLTGVVRGVGSLGISQPLPLMGYGNLQAYVEIGPAPDPICPLPEIKSFPYQSMLQEGDLTLCLTDASGNPYSPVSVTYAIYEVLPGGYRKLRGPAKRTPVSPCVGSYYATGYVGDCGQPGDWVIVWSYGDNGACKTLEEPFQLIAGPPLTPPCGCAPTGWE